jgi:hypothetical protein
MPASSSTTSTRAITSPPANLAVDLADPPATTARTPNHRHVGARSSPCRRAAPRPAAPPPNPGRCPPLRPVTKGSKRRGRISDGTPGPRSAIVKRSPSPSSVDLQFHTSAGASARLQRVAHEIHQRLLDAHRVEAPPLRRGGGVDHHPPRLGELGGPPRRPRPATAGPGAMRSARAKSSRVSVRRSRRTASSTTRWALAWRRGSSIELLLEQLGVALEAGERVADLVREHGRQLAERGEVAALGQALLGQPGAPAQAMKHPRADQHRGRSPRGWRAGRGAPGARGPAPAAARTRGPAAPARGRRAGAARRAGRGCSGRLSRATPARASPSAGASPEAASTAPSRPSTATRRRPWEASAGWDATSRSGRGGPGRRGSGGVASRRARNRRSPSPSTRAAMSAISPR